VLRDFPDDGALVEPPVPVQASAVPVAEGAPGDPVEEARAIREAHAAWRARNGGRTAFGLSGVSAAEFAEVAVAFLRSYAAGDAATPPRTDVPVPQLLRWCADDLKALYQEARMATHPAATGEELARWFWGATAAGQLLRRVRDRLDASGDPQSKAAAFGIAR
jgi:hypothetical protein